MAGEVERDPTTGHLKKGAVLNPSGDNGFHPGQLKDVIREVMAEPIAKGAKQTRLKAVLRNMAMMACSFDKSAPAAARLLFEYGWGKAPVEVDLTVRRVSFDRSDDALPADFETVVADVGGLIEAAVPASEGDNHRNGSANRQNGSR